MKKGRGEKEKIPASHQTVSISGSGGTRSPLRFEALRESHIHINAGCARCSVGLKAALKLHSSQATTIAACQQGRGRRAQVGRGGGVGDGQRMTGKGFEADEWAAVCQKEKTSLVFPSSGLTFFYT